MRRRDKVFLLPAVAVGEGGVGGESDRGIMASAESVVMNVDMLAMEARNF